ncbi:hypothetical protein BHU72_14235 [Desulfuribacillus stibiiarsenatis]|uniref:Uncharacterized protein n=1 Tax=Desulfuribacillus stibiiarsenatis TaxID=1390249 RepID=A0A1E5L818_9FIRM|nr:hypothetical protein [Desulfuribacillus stibiiarsenatis]OEH86083.1 hypothetical protein BHU72_14235 [Desulfuribacillus stibiiarsenatis]
METTLLKSWENLLIKSGFVFEIGKSEIKLEMETEDNVKYLMKILQTVGVAFEITGYQSLRIKEIVDEDTWFNAIEQLHTGAEGGPHDDIKIMDTYMAGIVRRVNEIGLRTDFSCDGHGTRRPRLSFYNKSDAIIFDCCLQLLSNQEWSYKSNYEICRNQRNALRHIRDPRTRSIIERDFSREWLLDIAEALYTHKAALQRVVEASKRIDVATHTF